jgi:DeoR family fructose operon transcriptional repressor
MFAAERVEKIKGILNEYKHVDVTTLSNVLSVSEATIRRDLERLEGNGFLKRTHGGAVINEKAAPDTTITRDDILNYEEKCQVGYIAAQLVENNEVIIAGAGATCLQFAKHLKGKKNLTIVTNNILVISELSTYKEIKVIATGGDVYANEDAISLVGEFAHKMLENIHVNKAFLGVSGVDLSSGYTANSSELALVWKKMHDVARETIILSDYTKFGKTDFVKLGPLDLAAKMITNEQVAEYFKKYYFDKGIPIYTSYKLESINEQNG